MKPFDLPNRNETEGRIEMKWIIGSNGGIQIER